MTDFYYIDIVVSYTERIQVEKETFYNVLHMETIMHDGVKYSLVRKCSAIIQDENDKSKFHHILTFK